MHESVAQGRQRDGAVGPRRTHIEQLRTPQGENEQRAVGRPFEQVVDELEQAAVGPLEILEHQDHLRLLGDALQEQPPAAEQISAIRCRARLETQKMCEARLDQPALALVGDVQLDGRAELAPR
jgi:hypothetical protein